MSNEQTSGRRQTETAVERIVSRADSGEIVVLITCPEDVAEELAATVVEERLAACVNALPRVQSVYRWEGKIQKDTEALLIVKTVLQRFGALAARIREIHPYSCPEIVATPVVAGFTDYLRWMRAETEDTNEE